MSSPAIRFAPAPQRSTCRLCSCTFLSPCLGALVLTPAQANVHRTVSDTAILRRGETCAWLDDGETVCSAHSDQELDQVAAVVAHEELGDLGV